MNPKTLKDLSKLADICRKKGIAEIKVDENGVEFKLWDHIPSRPRKGKSSEVASSNHIPVENMPTEEELLFWSSPGIDDGQLKDNN